MKTDKKLESFKDVWIQGRKIEGKTPHFTTGQIARIFGWGMKNRRRVADLIDEEALKGRSIDGRHGNGSRSYRVVSFHDLAEYIEKHGNITAKRWLLAQKTETLKKAIARESGRSGVLHIFKGLPDALLTLIANLDPLESLNGTSEDKSRLAIVKKLADVMDRHIKLRHALAKSKKPKK